MFIEFCHHKSNDDIIVTVKTMKGDEIRRRHPNFVTLGKNEFSRPSQCPRLKWPGQSLGHCSTDFNAGKYHWVTIRKFGEKKFFRSKV
jgi:hypothetical protein